MTVNKNGKVFGVYVYGTYLQERHHHNGLDRLAGHYFNYPWDKRGDLKEDGISMCAGNFLLPEEYL